MLRASDNIAVLSENGPRFAVQNAIEPAVSAVETACISFIYQYPNSVT